MTVTRNEEPLPCPFCGSTVLKSGGDDKVVGFWCLTCEAAGPNHYGRHEWNDRAYRSAEAGKPAVPELSGQLQWAMADAFEASKADTTAGKMIAVYDALRSAPSTPADIGPVAWECAAKRQGTAGGSDPADCDWPLCGCDPYADRVIAALDEIGYADPVGPEVELPWSAKDIMRGLILFRTSNNAHGYTNVSILSERVDSLSQVAKDELANMMRNIAAELAPIPALSDVEDA